MKLYTKLSSYELIDEAWKSILRNKSIEKRKRGRDINGISLEDYSKDSSERLKELLNKLVRNEYSSGTLKGFEKLKKDKVTYRLIGIAEIDDRIVQKAILLLLNPIVSHALKNGVSFGSLSRGRLRESDDYEPVGIKGAMSKFIIGIISQKTWIFKTDIEGFYDNIYKEQMYIKITKLLPDATINKLLREIIFTKWGNKKELKSSTAKKYKYGIAQGPPLSTMFSNVYLIDFDKKMKLKYGESYIRYADDFVVLTSSESEARQAKKYATGLLKIERLKLSGNKEKTLIMNLKVGSITYLGLSINRSRISPKKSSTQYQQEIVSRLKARNELQININNLNNYIRGSFESFKDYHSTDIINRINKILLNIKRINKYNSIKLLDANKLTPIIAEENWRKLFKKNG